MHFKNEVKKYEWMVLLFFLLFFGYGCYKNGLSYVFLGKMTFVEALKPLMFLLVSIILSLLFSLLEKRKITCESFIRGLLFVLLLPPTFPLLYFSLYTLVFYVFLWIGKKWFPKVSYLSLYMVGILLLTEIFQIGLENMIEKEMHFQYGTIDIFFGRGLGGFGTTNIFLIILCYFVLCSYYYYKRELPIYAFATYSICFFVHYFMHPSFYTFQSFLAPSVFFSFVFFLPQNETSSATKRGKFLTGLLAGLLSFVFIHLLFIKEGAYYAVLLTNLFWILGHRIYFFLLSTKCDKKNALQLKKNTIS